MPPPRGESLGTRLPCLKITSVCRQYLASSLHWDDPLFHAKSSQDGGSPHPENCGIASRLPIAVFLLMKLLLHVIDNTHCALLASYLGSRPASSAVLFYCTESNGELRMWLELGYSLGYMHTSVLYLLCTHKNILVTASGKHGNEATCTHVGS